MHRRLTRYILLLACTCLLSACGFQLRGVVTMPPPCPRLEEHAPGHRQPQQRVQP